MIKTMESKFKIGDRFVIKGSRDSMVIEIERIFHHFGQKPTYELKTVPRCGNRHILGEDSLSELYIKVN